jgi:hypothetical protein
MVVLTWNRLTGSREAQHNGAHKQTNSLPICFIFATPIFIRTTGAALAESRALVNLGHHCGHGHYLRLRLYSTLASWRVPGNPHTTRSGSNRTRACYGFSVDRYRFSVNHRFGVSHR